MYCVPGFELFQLALGRAGANYLEIGVFTRARAYNSILHERTPRCKLLLFKKE